MIFDDCDYYFVPGIPGDKAFVIERGVDGKRFIKEGIIDGITCHKRKESFCVKYRVNVEENLCLTQRECIYGIDVFVSEDEANAAIEMLEGKK